MQYASITREIYVKLFISTFVIQIVNTVSFFLDFIIPGSFLGEEALSVITLVMPMLLLVMAFTDTVSMGSSHVFSQEIGAGNQLMAARYLTATLVGSFLTGMLFFLLGWVFLDPLVDLLGADETVFDTTKQVTFFSLGYFILVPFMMCLDFFARNDGRIRLSAGSNIVFIICNVVLNIYLVGYTSLGILGAPLSALLSALLGIICLLPAFFYKNTTLHFSRQASLSDFLHVLRMGIGLSFKHIYQGATILVFNNFLMDFYGMVGVVVYSIIVNVQALVSGIFDSIRECMQPLLSSYLGEKNLLGIRETIRCSCAMGIFFCLLCWAFLELMPVSTLYIFGIDDEEILVLCMEAIHIYAFILPFFCFTEIISSYYQFSGYARMTFYILTLKGLVLILPVSVLGFCLYGLTGLWLGLIVTEILVTIYCLLVARWKARRHVPVLSDILLLDKEIKENSIVLDFPLSYPNLLQTIEQLDDFLQKNHIASCNAARIRLCLEEIGRNILQYNAHRNNIRMEIQLHIEAEIRLTIRDNCAAFHTKNELLHLDKEDATKWGLRLVNYAADEFDYVPTIGYNRTILIFKAV